MVLNFLSQTVGIGVVCTMLFPAAALAQQPSLNLIPVPASTQAGTGSLRVDSSFSVTLTGHVEPRLDRGAQRFLQQLARQTALPLSLKPAKTAQATLVIHTDRASKEIQEVGEDESYVLEVSAGGQTSPRRRHSARCTACRPFFNWLRSCPMDLQRLR